MRRANASLRRSLFFSCAKASGPIPKWFSPRQDAHGFITLMAQPHFGVELLRKIPGSTPSNRQTPSNLGKVRSLPLWLIYE
jgi:hypothetical protein